ncbi:MAG TPA: DEAD/DEAH box helicase, partial [Burkholderiales bacterium]
MTILRVALDVPVPKLFDYRSEGATQADIGYRALVPFGNKRLVGVILDIATKSEIENSRLRPVDKILRDVAPLPHEWLALAEFCSRYYHCPTGEVISAALPPRLRTSKTVPALASEYVLTSAGKDALATIPTRRRRLRALLERLSSGRASESELDMEGRSVRSSLKSAIESGWVASIDPRRSDPRFVHVHALTAEQQQAVNLLHEGLEKFRVSLLFGVTGSGKTEIYFHLIAEILARRKQALILVPEIALTPSLDAAFRDRFPGACIVTQTSAMAELERVRGWLLAHSGRADIVLGTRLAVFTPLPNLGLVVVDEEQDASFKQQEGVRYSARDLAVTRAHIAGAPVVLCSATPSLESFHHATSGKYDLVPLTRRAIDRAVLPAIRMIDTRAHPPQEGFAPPLLEALAARIARGEQSLVFLN